MHDATADTDSGCAVCSAPAGDDGNLCVIHTRDLIAELSEVDELLDELDVTITRQSRTTAERNGSRSTTTPLPWNEHASARRSELWSTLGAWALDVSKLGEDERDHLADIDTHDTAGVAQWLVRNMSTLRQHEEAGTAHDELIDAVRQVRRAIDLSPNRTRFPTGGPCIEWIDTEDGSAPCDGEVWAFIASDPEKLSYMRCQACDASWSSLQWIRAGREMLRRMEQIQAERNRTAS